MDMEKCIQVHPSTPQMDQMDQMGHTAPHCTTVHQPVSNSGAGQSEAGWLQASDMELPAAELNLLLGSTLRSLLTSPDRCHWRRRASCCAYPHDARRPVFWLSLRLPLLSR